MRIGGASTALLLLAAAPAQGQSTPTQRKVRDAAPVDILSDRQLLAFAQRPIDKAAMMNRRVTLGKLRGVTVIVTYPCSDVCPDYTTRIIQYELAPGPDCVQAGGVERIARVPSGVAATDRTFCVPAVLGRAPIPLGGG